MPKRDRLFLDNRQLLSALDELVRTMPSEEPPWPPKPEFHSWVGDARALIGNWDATEDVPFAALCDALFVRSRDAAGARFDALNARAKVMNLIQTARS